MSAKMSRHEIEKMARGLDHACMAAMEQENRALKAEAAAYRGVLDRLLDDVQDYEAWQRPCDAVDQARAVLARYPEVKP